MARQRVRFRVEERGSEALVLLSGDLAENAQLERLTAQLPPRGNLVLDLAEIGRINSPGVHKWLAFLRALTSSGRKVSFQRCSLSVVRQLNLIFGFDGGAEVRSIFAPYYCGRCKSTQLRLIDLGSSLKAQLEVPMHCESCRLRVDLDDLADAFFSFTRS